ncbi:MAG: Replicative DNA helicase, partial [Candidatus Gottesmanbacteria bacterium GW2011_GWC2_39_8]
MDIKVPPHDDESEKSVLGAILIDKDALAEVVDFLRPEFFYNDLHGMVYDAML